MTKVIALRVDPFFFDCIATRVEEVAVPTVTDYVKTLIRNDIMRQERVLPTGGLFRLHHDEQAKFDRRLSEAYRSGNIEPARLQFEAISQRLILFKEAA